MSAGQATPLYLEYEGRLLMDTRPWQESAPYHGAARMQVQCAGASGMAHTGLARCVNWRALPRRPLPAWEFKDYLGWMEQGDGKLAYGIFIANGRLKGARRAGWPAPASRGTLLVALTADWFHRVGRQWSPVCTGPIDAGIVCCLKLLAISGARGPPQ